MNKDTVHDARTLLGNLLHDIIPGETVTELPIIYPFTFESFTPEILVPKNGRRRERMERMKETFNRVSSYLRNSGTDLEQSNQYHHTWAGILAIHAFDDT